MAKRKRILGSTDCPYCGGRMTEHPCRQCGGSGAIHYDAGDPPHVVCADPCWRCEGFGARLKCQSCGTEL